MRPSRPTDPAARFACRHDEFTACASDPARRSRLACRTPAARALPRRLIHRPSEDQSMNKTFDYIVVGGGSGGSVVAGRLTETRP